METIKIEDLKEWLVDYITMNIHSMESEESEEFNNWAKSFEKEEAEFVVRAEFVNDWGYDNRNEISIKEASEYAQALIQRILSTWYF
nr:hypothetical protein [uncultured Prevotella sp.]